MTIINNNSLIQYRQFITLNTPIPHPIPNHNPTNQPLKYNKTLQSCSDPQYPIISTPHPQMNYTVTHSLFPTTSFTQSQSLSFNLIDSIKSATCASFL